ncbi:MAG TPA: sulfatase [Acidobacteriaceae bacterium]|nr:sulfatase [Acidobacteriaceae bacterium]
MNMEYSRRSFIELASVAAASKLVPAAKSTGERRPPNIILMLGDDHRWDALGCMGNEVIQTPHLDRLARDGVIFENHFTTTPICCASRASIMLGQYAGTHGIYDFDTPLNASQVSESYWMRLKQAGYRVGFIGKFGVGKTMPSESFDYWAGFPGQGNYFPKGPDGPHLTDIMRDQANEFIRNAPREKPFCLSISFKAPHVQDQDPRQYLPSKSTLSLYKDVTIPDHDRAGSNDINRFPLAIQHSESRRRWGVRFATPDIYQASMKGYYRLIGGIDEAVASIRETLSQQGLAGNTVIVYSADHGIFNGEHGLAGKWYAHEESIRIPLIIYDPRLPESSRGARRRAMTLNIDLHPTLLEIAGLRPTESAQGQSIVKLVQEEARDFRSVWFVEHHFPDGGWIPSSEGIRTGRWKYISYTDDAAPYEELYDLEKDPFETKNLIGDARYASQQHALSAYRMKWRDSLRAEAGRWTAPVGREDLDRAGLS